MFTSTDGKNYSEYEGIFYPIKDYTDTFSDGSQLVYLIIPFWTKLIMALRIGANYIKLAMQDWSIDISEEEGK